MTVHTNVINCVLYSSYTYIYMYCIICTLYLTLLVGDGCKLMKDDETIVVVIVTTDDDDDDIAINCDDVASVVMFVVELVLNNIVLFPSLVVGEEVLDIVVERMKL